MQPRSLKRSSSCTSVRKMFERKTDESPSPAAGENRARTLDRRRPQSLRKERVSLIEQGAQSQAAKRPQFQPGSLQSSKIRRQLERTSGSFGDGERSRPASFYREVQLDFTTEIEVHVFYMLFERWYSKKRKGSIKLHT